MINRRKVLSAVLTGMMAATAVAGSALVATAETAWPEKPVRIIVSFPPGGSSDLIARLLSEHLTTELGQQFVVENKPGAAGTVAATALMEAEGDGYTLMLSNLTPFSVAPTRFPDTPYDPIADFSHVTYIGTVNLGLFVRPSLEVSDFAGFMELVKSAPGDIDYGTSGVGSWGQVISVQFQAETGAEMVHVPYKGSGPLRQDFRADVIPVIFDAIPQNLPSVADGETIPLAVSSKERVPTLPDTPTFTELGYPIVAENWLGVSAPAGLDSEISAKLDGALQKVMAMPAVSDQFETWGIIRGTKTSAEFSDYVASQATSWAPLVKAAVKK
ncbi:MAG: tripartite tricarboxylate transporter substrate binding protein [Rhodobacteraceae bacterium]|nr:tripartite tricarboxylate transporter substrate binding protein [Paracoccaceae bacterium]